MDPIFPSSQKNLVARVYPHELDTHAVRKDSLVEDAYRALKASILDGTLPAGYQAVEHRIADQLNMSRTPVHEAVIRLQHEGLVQVLPRRGVRVLPISAADMAEVYQLLVAMEGMAAILLAQKLLRSGETVRKMEDATDEMERALRAEDLLRWAQADDQFHRLLVNECGNARLARVAATMVDQAQRARAVTLRFRPLPHASTEEHRRLTAAIRAGDAVGAREAAESHRARASNEIIRAIERL
ncbi:MULTISPECIES: GntR family transcriptional regulator [unclassified Sinorhizobium]|uniref:GntR family transcriptional regulator n=1 Tax=unclassified Sinorhizobium TaxID=2613772 RepID=UPI003525BA2C